MDKYLYKLVSVYLFLIGIAWVLYTIFSSFGTQCFDIFNAYVTIIVLLLDIVWINFIIPKKGDIQ